jgi:hypothetical protein
MVNRTLPTLLALVLCVPATAQPARHIEAYAPAGYGPAEFGGPGFAGEFVRGTYIGAPLTHIPRPTQIVPAPWSYGTYGIPTVTGIAPSPAAQPTLTVIDGLGPRGRRSARPLDDGQAAGARIIAVQVPRR